MSEENGLEEAPEKMDESSERAAGADSIGSMNDSSGNGPGSLSSRQSRLVIAGVVLIVILVVAGLLLPPISLVQRLSGDADSAASGQESAGQATAPEITLALDDATADAEITTLPQQEFSSGAAGDEWTAAASAIPTNLSLSSNVYLIEHGDQAPMGNVEIVIPAEAQPYETLDLYGWSDGSWMFIPSQVSDDDNRLTSASIPLPEALALMQTTAPTVPEIAAEVLPAQSLPAAVLPYLTEVTAGTLTLAPDGLLLGEVVSVPTGGYEQFVRATNSGAIVDTMSLASLLSDPAAQGRNIQSLVDTALGGDYSGVNLDYQGIDASQADAYTAYVDDLASALHDQGLMLIVTLEAPIQTDAGWDTAGQNWQAIGQIADAVYAQMPLDPSAYNDNGLAEQAISWATRQVDRYKLMALVSVNAVDSVGESNREVSNSEALADFGEISLVQGSTEVEPGETIEVALSGSASALEWDPDSLTYKYTYEQAGQPHDVWLGSEAVLSHRARLPSRYNLRGVATRGMGDVAEGAGYAAAVGSYLGAADAPQPASAAVVWAVENEAGGVVASSSGEGLTYSWDAPADPGNYVIQANFAQGDNVSSLGSLDISVQVEETPTPTPEPTEETVVEEPEEVASTPFPTAQAAAVDPGDADAVASVPANVRSGPGLGYGIIGGLNVGAAVSLTGRNEAADWLQIEMADGTEGWVFATLLTVNASVNVGSLAVVEVEPPAVASSSSGGGAPAPPVIAPAGGGSFELGGQTHTFANPALMSAAGMNWVKFQHKWGPGDSPDAVAGRIQQAHANNFKVLLSIPGGSSYPGSIDFSSYVEFLRGVAALGPDAIEVWNEENIDFEWPAGQIDPASYVNNMLAPAYNAIKSANPSVMVISGAPAPTGFDNGTNAWSDSRYMAGVAAAGGASYMDCIGVHHNAGATSPNAQSGHPAGGNHYSWYFFPTLNMYYNSFGGSRPVCFTELGFLSGQDFGGVPSRFSWAANTTVAQHAQWLAEAASLSANSGKVRLLIVFNVDFTLYSDDPQAGYAMLRPDGSCPSCGLLGQVMGR